MQINNTKNRIMNTCIELFANKTYDTVSLREIARNVGIKESSVYSHYSSKQEILEKILELQSVNENKQMDSLDSLRLKLKEDINNYSNILSEHMEVTRNPQYIMISKIVFKESFSNPIIKEAKQQKRAAAEIVDILIYELINQGLIDKSHESLLSKSLHGYNNHLLVEYLYKCTDISEGELISLYDEYIDKSIEYITDEVELFKKLTSLESN